MPLSYVKLYADTSGAVDLLSDAEAGRLFKAVLHGIAGVEDKLLGQERLVYAMLKAQFERDAEAYDRYSDKQRENGKKGGRPKKPTGILENPENPTVFLETQKSQNKDKDKDEDKEVRETGARARRFTPPTADDVRAYAREKGYTIDAERFVDFYASKGWLVGKSPMKDWKAAVRNWVSRDRQETPLAQPVEPVPVYTRDTPLDQVPLEMMDDVQRMKYEMEQYDKWRDEKLRRERERMTSDDTKQGG